MQRYYWFFAILAVVVVGLVAVETRLNQGVQQDQQVTDEISSVDQKAQDYASRHYQLPTAAELGTLKNGVTYNRTGQTSYDLCGTFQTTNRNYGTDTANSYGVIDATYHGRGYVCFHGTTNDDPLK